MSDDKAAEIKRVWKEIKELTGISLPWDPNPIQMKGWDCLPGKNENIVVATQASTGKTFFLEMAMALGKGGVYVTPTKALCEQKHDDWSKPGHPFSKSIVVKTSDHPTENSKLLAHRQYKLMTPEAFGSATRNLSTNGWLKDLRVLAVDEIHHFGSDGRGHKLEAALVDFFSIFQNCRVIAASATLPNAGEIGTWLTRLNGRESYVIQANWRPQPLFKHYVPFTHLLGSGAYFVNEQEMVSTAAAIVGTKPTEKFICFVHTKNAGWRLKKLLEEEYDIRPAFHNADLTLPQRKKLESDFTHGDLRVLIATSTVAAGCNFPARNVVVCGVFRGMNEVNPLDLIQMSERAGRPGFDDKGDAFFLLPSPQVDLWKQKLAQPPPIESQINKIANLAFHLVAGVAKERVTDEVQLEKWYSKTFAHHAGEPITEAKHIIDRLLKAKAIVVDEETQKWKATALGRAAASFYYDPFDILAWHANFSRLKATGLTNTNKIPDIVLAWAVGNAPSGSSDFITKDCKPAVGEAMNRLEHVSHQLGLGLSCMNTQLGITAAYTALQDPEEVGDGEIPGGIRFAMFSLQGDAERITAVMKYVDSSTRLGMVHVIEETLIRIKYRVPPEAVELCRVKFVGRARAMWLLTQGFRTAFDIVQREEEVIEKFGAYGERITSDARKKLGKDVKKAKGGHDPFATRKPKIKGQAPATKKGVKKGVKKCVKKKTVKKKAVKKQVPKRKPGKKKGVKKKAKR